MLIDTVVPDLVFKHCLIDNSKLETGVGHKNDLCQSKK
jgi:hypothetical protein